MRRLSFLLLLPYVVISYGVVLSFPNMPAIGSVSRMAGLPALAAWLFTLYYTGSMRKWHAFHNWFALFIVWNAASFIWSIDQNSVVYFLYRYLLFLGVIIVIWDSVRERVRTEWLMQALVFGGYLLCLSAMWNYHKGVGYFSGPTGNSDRFSATNVNPNEAANLLAMAMPLGWYLAIFQMKEHALLRFLNYAFPFLGFATLALTASRGGTISTIPTFVYIVATYPRARFMWKGAIWVMLGAALFFLSKVDLSAQITRIKSIGYEVTQASDNESLNGRKLIWNAGWMEFKEHPIIGEGAGSFQAAIANKATYRMLDGSPPVAHNTYLSLLVELGVVGLLLFLATFLSAVRELFRTDKSLRYAWLATLCSYALALMAGSWEISTDGWLVLGTCVACSVAHREREARLASAKQREALPAPLDPAVLAS